jgi:hypothetical protein
LLNPETLDPHLISPSLPSQVLSVTQLSYYF